MSFPGSPPRLWGKRLAGFFNAQLSGSPPRLWGKLGRGRPTEIGSRFTPTPVGKTLFEKPPADTETVHPHACGENATGKIRSAIPPGSPPRLWGKRRQMLVSPLGDTVHPHACGENACATCDFLALPVHPHACGENVTGLAAGLGVSGSPPRLWGKLHANTVFIQLGRFTPTPVGKTNGAARSRRTRRFTPTPVGKTPAPPAIFWRCRFTPTPVGKTLARAFGQSACAVHPHACGENAALTELR